MSTSSRIEFIPAPKPITELVTKFGGQPSWLDAPQWPLSRETGNPMRFIAQVVIEPPAFEGGHGKMAYIFMTDEEEYVDGTWEPDGGENAVVVQPGNFAGPTTNTSTGPSLYEMAEIPGKPHLEAQPVEFGVKLHAAEEPPFQSEQMRQDWTDDQFERYVQALEGNKIGGSPVFLQYDEFPGEGEWKLLLQLDSTAVPFYVNFGDAGVAYAFLDSQESEGKLLWQCC